MLPGKWLSDSMLISAYSTSCSLTNVSFSYVWEGLAYFYCWFSWSREYIFFTVLLVLSSMSYDLCELVCEKCSQVLFVTTFRVWKGSVRRRFFAFWRSWWGQKSCWMVSEGFERVGSGFPHFDSPHLGGFSGPFTTGLERILLPLVNIIFALEIWLSFKLFFMDFVCLMTRKSVEKAWRVVQNHVIFLSVIKSTCEAILDWFSASFGSHFGFWWGLGSAFGRSYCEA